MTIDTTTTVITYQGNNATTIWSFPFVGDQPSDLIVEITTAGISTILLPTQYSIAFNPIPVGGLWSIGGTVTYPLTGSPLATGKYISIIRAVPYVQDVSINNQGAFYPQAVEQGLDILELQIQQLATLQEYSIQTPLSDITPPTVLPGAAARANMYLFFDSAGNPTVLGTAPPPPVNIGTINPRVITTTGTATISILVTDSLAGVRINQSSSPVTTLQLPSTLGPYPVYDGNFNASTYPITILPPGGKTIIGQSSYVINVSGGSVLFAIDTAGNIVVQ